MSARLPPAVACSLARGESALLCDTPRSLPPSGSPAADFVALPFAFAWLYPDSMLLVEALACARRGLILHGPLASGGVEPAAMVARLRRLMSELRLASRWHDANGRRIDETAAGAALADGGAVLRAERP